MNIAHNMKIKNWEKRNIKAESQLPSSLSIKILKFFKNFLSLYFDINIKFHRSRNQYRTGHFNKNFIEKRNIN